MLDKTIKEACLINVAVRNSHSLYNAITEKLQTYTDLREELTRIWQLNAVHIVPLVLSTTGIIPDKLHDSLKLLNLRSGLYILMQKAIILNFSNGSTAPSEPGPPHYRGFTITLKHTPFDSTPLDE
jgi:hypothetical protein